MTVKNSGEASGDDQRMENGGVGVLAAAGAERARNRRRHAAAHGAGRHHLHQHDAGKHQRDAGQRVGAELADEIGFDQAGGGLHHGGDDVRDRQPQQGRRDRRFEQSSGARVQNVTRVPRAPWPKSFAANGARSSMPSPTPMKWIGSLNFSAMRNQDAAARGAVELGHHQPGDAGDLAEHLDLRQRVLADGGVEHQQHGVRRGWRRASSSPAPSFPARPSARRGSAGGRRCRRSARRRRRPSPRSAPRRQGSPSRSPARARRPWRRCAGPRS